MCEKEIVLKHFNGISTTYDENNKKVYWKLADDNFLKYIITWGHYVL